MKLGSNSLVNVFLSGMEKTLNFYLYEDDNEYIHMLNPLSEKLKLTPEVGDNYIDANLVIPRRDSEALGRLIFA